MSDRTSLFELPAGSCDCHCHVFGPRERFPYSAARSYEPANSPKETLAALHAKLGVSRAVLIQPNAYGVDNRAMLDALRTGNGRYRGVAVIDETVSDRELVEMADAGVRGVRFSFVQSLGGYPDPEAFNRAIERIRPLGWHVVLHVRGEDILKLEDVIRALSVPFLIDHLGRVEASEGVDQPAFRTLLALLELNGAWVKASAPERMADFPYDDAIPFARALVDKRPDRVLWGTDFPHPNLTTPVDEVDLVNLIPRFAFDTRARRQILVDNPAELYGFPPIAAAGA